MYYVGCLLRYSWYISPRIHFFGDGDCDIPGDLNVDGGSDISDVVLMVDIIFQGNGATGYQLYVADLDNDGEITIIDVVWLVDMILNEWITL